jgi:hypothetical protein
MEEQHMNRRLMASTLLIVGSLASGGALASSIEVRKEE